MTHSRRLTDKRLNEKETSLHNSTAHVLPLAHTRVTVCECVSEGGHRPSPAVDFTPLA